jgi:hypothetical protein
MLKKQIKRGSVALLQNDHNYEILDKVFNYSSENSNA